MQVLNIGRPPHRGVDRLYSASASISARLIALVCDEFTDFVCQQSWNPVFGNDDFNMDDEATYNLRLVLTRETFKGLPLAVRIQVNVVNPS